MTELTTDYTTMKDVVDEIRALSRTQKNKIADLEQKGGTAAEEKNQLEERLATLEELVKQLSLVRPEIATATPNRNNLLAVRQSDYISASTAPCLETSN